MTGAARDPGTSANFRYTTSTDVTVVGRPARPPAKDGSTDTRYKYAVLWDLNDTSQPAGIATERPGFVLVDVRNGCWPPRRRD